MSGYQEDEVFPEKGSANRVAYLKKPFTSETLLLEVCGRTRLRHLETPLRRSSDQLRSGGRELAVQWHSGWRGVNRHATVGTVTLWGIWFDEDLRDTPGNKADNDEVDHCARKSPTPNFTRRRSRLPFANRRRGRLQR